MVSTVASGEFRARIAFDERSIEYKLTYNGLQGTVTQGHIHIAQPNVNGVIVIGSVKQRQSSGCRYADLPVVRHRKWNCNGCETSCNRLRPLHPQQILAGELSEVIALIRGGFLRKRAHESVARRRDSRADRRQRQTPRQG